MLISFLNTCVLNNFYEPRDDFPFFFVKVETLGGNRFHPRGWYDAKINLKLLSASFEIGQSIRPAEKSWIVDYISGNILAKKNSNSQLYFF